MIICQEKRWDLTCQVACPLVTGPVAGILGPTGTQRRWTSGQGISGGYPSINGFGKVNDRTQNSTGKSVTAVLEGVMVVTFGR